MDLFGTGDFPLLTVNISVVNSLNWFTFSSRLCELQSCRRCTTRTPNRARAPELQTKPLPESRDSSGRPICTVLHVDYHCLYSSLFGFFCFQLGWGRPLCVYWGEGLKIIIPNFLMYCLFFFFWLLLYHFKFWPQASIWARGLLEASSFLYLVMNVNRCFYYTKLNVISRS